MLKRILIASTFCVILAAGNSAFARPEHAGGNSETHMSNEGMQNTNGPESSDRDKGQQRAEDRQNAHGAEHEHHKGGKHHGHGEKHHGHHHGDNE